jgi:hypothetical protein
MVATSPTTPGRDPWRGGAAVYVLKARTIDYERKELGYDIEKQEK